MFLHILFFVFSLNITDVSEASFSILSVDTKQSCKFALTVDPSDELGKAAEAKAIITRFYNSRRYYRIIQYSYFEKLFAINLVEVLDGNVGLAAKKLGINFPILYGWVTFYEIENGVSIRSVEATEEEKAYGVWLVKEYNGNVEAVSVELRIDPKTLRHWVNEHQEKKNAQIRDTRVSKPYTYEVKARAIRKVIEYGGNMSEVARELKIPVSTLRIWIIKHETEHDVQIRGTRVIKTYTDKVKAHAIRKVIEYGGNMSEVARQLNIPAKTLQHWIIKYETKNDVQIRDIRVVKTYTDEEKARAINRVKELGGNMNAVARELNISVGTLRYWVLLYEKKNNVQIRNTRGRVIKIYTDEEKARAINRVEELGGNLSVASRELNILRMTLYRWTTKHERENGVQIRNTKPRKRASNE